MGGPVLNEKQLDGFVAGIRPEFEKMLGGLVEVPTISANPEHSADIRRGADLAVQYLRSFGASAEKMDTPGNPVVVGQATDGPVQSHDHSL